MSASLCSLKMSIGFSVNNQQQFFPLNVLPREVEAEARKSPAYGSQLGSGVLGHRRKCLLRVRTRDEISDENESKEKTVCISLAMCLSCLMCLFFF